MKFMLLTSLKKSLKGNYSICQSSGHCHVATESMKDVEIPLGSDSAFSVEDEQWEIKKWNAL